MLTVRRRDIGETDLDHPGELDGGGVLPSSENLPDQSWHDRNSRTINTTNASHGFETHSRHPNDQGEKEGKRRRPRA